MSDLAKTIGKSKLGNKAPSNNNSSSHVHSNNTTASIANNNHSKIAEILEEEPGQQQSAEDDSSSASSVSSTGTVVPPSTQKQQQQQQPGVATITNTPPQHQPTAASAANTDWTRFFAQELFLDYDGTRGDEDDDAAATDPSPSPERAQYHVYVTPPATPKTPVLVLHHGGGSSALTWGLFAREARRLMPDVGILAVEARGHGSAVFDAAAAAAEGGGGRCVDGDMAVAKLSRDLARMVGLTARKLGWGATMPPLLLVGHSLGGAVVVEAAKTGVLPGAPASVMGYAVLDVVEGSAMDALKHMHTYLSTRPSMFPSLDAAVEWHIRSRTLRNPESARASVPSLLRRVESGRWVWKTDLALTEPYWTDWFQGMSGKFLTARGAKLLLLAGTDRLDKELMIGQMQGKFQLQVYPTAGHFIQEDVPDQCAQTVIEFLKRNDRSSLVLPPKVSDLLAQGKKV